MKPAPVNSAVTWCVPAGNAFVHVATPMLTEAVYVRGDLGNPSPYHLLPGRTAIFLGQDYIGPTSMPSVTPGGQFKMHFGIDQSVRARRQLASKSTENTGLLSGGRRTTSDYRIAIDNGSRLRSNDSILCATPLSRTVKLLASRSVTKLPFGSVTVTGTVTTWMSTAKL